MKKGFIILFILTLFLEIFVFNYKSYRVLSSKNEIEFSKKDFSLVEQTDEYKYVEIENIDEEVKTLHIFLDNVTNGTKYEVFYTDETSSGFRYLGTKNYAKNVWKSTYLDTYLSGKSKNSLKNEYKVSEGTIGRALKRNNIHIRQVSETNISKYNINHSFFEKDNINSNSAYILGLIASDGCVSKVDNCISIELKSDDIELLEEVNKILEN